MLKFEQIENCKHSIKILLRRKNIWFLRRTNHYTNTLGASVGRLTTQHKPTEKQWTKCQRFVKLKELQANTQANAFAAHLILPNHTQSPPTTQLADTRQLDDNF